MARIAFSLPNEAMVRIAFRRNGTISLDPSCRVKIPEHGSLDLIRNSSRILKQIQKEDRARLFQKSGSSPPPATHHHHHQNDERERLAAASPVTTKSWAPSWGKQ
jgi:hypothetical protein